MCLVGLVFGVVNIGYSEDTSLQASLEELYQKAIALKEVGDNNAALDILKKIANDSSNNQIRYTDILVEQGIIMKDMNMPTWKSPTKEAAYKIKLLYKKNYNNPEYWLVYAKYAALVNKERHVYGAFQKAFFFKPDYVEGNIAKGTAYTYLAKNTDPSETTASAAIGYEEVPVSKENSARYNKGKEAKEFYEVALKNSTLDNGRKAYIHYKIGELEMNILSNKEAAVKNWKKTVELSPDSLYGKKSAELLSKNQ
jgi:tetratricopeptide (TPR) repeat protein